jgi:hypothetical protein
MDDRITTDPSAAKQSLDGRSLGEPALDRSGSVLRALAVTVAVGMLVLGLMFRVQAAGDFLWLDEQHTAWSAKTHFVDVAFRAAEGNQTPLFFYAAWAALRVGGESALSLRLPSLICGAVLLGLVPWYVFRRTACVAALWVLAAWFLFHYDAVFYASEARPYAMVQLLGAIQAGIFLNWLVTRNEPDKACRKLTVGGGWVAVLTAMIFYTHPTGMLLVVAEILFAAGYCLWHRRVLWQAWKEFGCTVLLGSLLLLPGMVLVRFLWQRKSNWTAVSNATEVFWCLGVESVLMILFPLVMLGVDRLFVRQSAVDNREHRRWPVVLAFVGIWAVLPRLLIATLDAAGWVSLGIDRYAIVGSVAFPLFAALAIAAMRREGWRWVTAVLIISGSVWGSEVVEQLREGGFRHENWEEVINLINAEDESLPVFLVANLIEDVAAETDRAPRFQSYLGFPLTGIPALIRPNRIVPRPSQGTILSEENLDAIVDCGGGFVVVRDAEIYRDAIRLEITAVLQSRQKTRSARLFAAPMDRPRPNNVHLFWIRLEPIIAGE